MHKAGAGRDFTPQRYAVCAIPLHHPEVAGFLNARHRPARGAPVGVIAQRPTAAAERAWIAQLRDTPTVATLLAIDDPHGHVEARPTDRLVPVELLDGDADYLSRSLGGWAPIYFGVLGEPHGPSDDPLLAARRVLTDYGPRIRAHGADPAQVAERVEVETGRPAARVAAELAALHALRRNGGHPDRLIEVLYAAAGGARLPDGTDVAPLLALDALMATLIDLEQARRDAVADGQQAHADTLAVTLEGWRARHGLRLLLKSEYIAGRHRRSTVLIAPELGVVAKQPAPEPDHDITIGQPGADGRPENWPHTVADGALVTARGRLGMIVADGLIPRLDLLSGRQVTFSTLLGLIVEPFVPGPTLQELVLADPAAMTADRYDELVLAQQLCEALGVDNPDWHAANFIVGPDDGALVHIDWGAATPLADAARTDPSAARQRLDKVANVAFSFHDAGLAERVAALHAALLDDPDRLARLRARADRLAGGAPPAAPRTPPAGAG